MLSYNLYSKRKKKETSVQLMLFEFSSYILGCVLMICGFAIEVALFIIKGDRMVEDIEKREEERKSVFPGSVELSSSKDTVHKKKLFEEFKKESLTKREDEGLKLNKK